MSSIIVGLMLFAWATAGAQWPPLTNRVPPGAVSRPRLLSFALPYPGWELFSDSASWHEFLQQQALFQAYAPGDQSPEYQFRGPNAWMDVDFSRHEVLLVGLQWTSGCDNQFDIIAEIRTARRERVAYLDPSPFREELTCSAAVDPFDIVLIPRSKKPLRVVMRDQNGRPTLRYAPPAAQWWVQVSLAAALDTSSDPVRAHARAVSRRTLVLDTLGPEVYRAISRAAYLEKDEWIRNALAQNPAATRDLETLAWLSSGRPYEHAERKARLLLLPRFGLLIGRDSSAPLPWLDAVVESLGYYETDGPNHTPMYSDVAMALALNPAIHRSRDVLLRLTSNTYRYPQAQAAACRAWAQRYPPSYQIGPDSLGRVYTWSPMCSSVPTRTQSPSRAQAPRLYDSGRPIPAGTRVAIQFNNERPIFEVADGKGGPQILYHGRELNTDELKSVRVLPRNEARQRFKNKTLDFAIVIEVQASRSHRP
jgi:hypothetical protein